MGYKRHNRDHVIAGVGHYIRIVSVVSFVFSLVGVTCAQAAIVTRPQATWELADLIPDDESNTANALPTLVRSVVGGGGTLNGHNALVSSYSGVCFQAMEAVTCVARSLRVTRLFDYFTNMSKWTLVRNRFRPPKLSCILHSPTDYYPSSETI